MALSRPTRRSLVEEQMPDGTAARCSKRVRRIGSTGSEENIEIRGATEPSLDVVSGASSTLNKDGNDIGNVNPHNQLKNNNTIAEHGESEEETRREEIIKMPARKHEAATKVDAESPLTPTMLHPLKQSGGDGRDCFDEKLQSLLRTLTAETEGQFLKALEDSKPEDAKKLRTMMYTDNQVGTEIAILHKAAQLGLSDLVKYLLEKGANANQRCALGMSTPLHFAAAGRTKKHGKVMSLLLEHGADVNAQNVCGYTALHDAAANNSHIAAQTLITAEGIDFNIPNDDGWTAEIVAAFRGYYAISTLIQQASMYTEYEHSHTSTNLSNPKM